MTYIIAEIGNNHEGDPAQAIELADAAMNCGVDAVKMQLFRADTLVDKDMLVPPQAQGKHTTQWERLKSLELRWDVYEEILALCTVRGIDLIITPLDVDLVDDAACLADKLKVASGDLTYQPLLRAVKATGKPALLSTGMANHVEIDRAFMLLDPYAILHCVSLYPTPPHCADLGRIANLAERYPTRTIGYSDHCIGIDACRYAIAAGAQIIEKHFTLTPHNPTGDHKHSATIGMMKQLVKEKEQIAEYAQINPAQDLHMCRWLRRGSNGLRGSYTE